MERTNHLVKFNLNENNNNNNNDLLSYSLYFISISLYLSLYFL